MPFMQQFEEKSRPITAAGYLYMLVASPKGSSTCFVSSPPACKAEKLRVTYDSAIKECTYLLTGKRPLAAHFVELPKKEQELAELKEKLEANKAHLKQLEEKRAKEKEAKLDDKALKKVQSAKGALVTRYSGADAKKYTIFFRDPVFFDQTKSGVIFFCEGKERTEHASSAIALATITGITLGNKTASFKTPHAEKAKPECCFTIASKEHTLEIETKTPKMRESWIRGIMVLARAKGLNITCT